VCGRLVGTSRTLHVDRQAWLALMSADALADERSGSTCFCTEVAIDAEAMRQLDWFAVVPGLAFDTLIRTLHRTPRPYLLEPFTEHSQNARARRGT
jgi:hypothetical protein